MRKRDKKANTKTEKRQQSFRQLSQDEFMFEDVFMTAMERAPVTVTEDQIGEFRQSYLEKFLKESALSRDEDLVAFARENLKCLSCLYKIVKDLGGFREAVAEQKWPEIVHKVDWPDTIIERSEILRNPRQSAKVARHIYEKYLFHYEKTVNPKTKLALTDPKHGVKLEDLDPSLMREVDVFEI